MYRRRIGRRKLKTSVKVVIICISLIVALILLDWYLSPIIKTNMKVYSEDFITRQIDTSVYDKLSELNVTYDSLIIADRSSSNNITALNLNTVEVNKLKAQICLEIQEKLSEKQDECIHIPLGNIIGSTIFTGLGPSMKVKMTFLPTMTSDIESEFLSAGVNQTKHRVYFTVYVGALMALPPYSESVQTTSKVLIAETVIVGDVPAVYWT